MSSNWNMAKIWLRFVYKLHMTSKFTRFLNENVCFILDLARENRSTEICLWRCGHCQLPNSSMETGERTSANRRVTVIRWFGLRKWTIGVYFIIRRSYRLWNWRPKKRHLGHLSIDYSFKDRGNCTVRTVAMPRHRLDYWQSFGRTITMDTSDGRKKFIQLSILSITVLCIQFQWSQISTEII